MAQTYNQPLLKRDFPSSYLINQTLGDNFYIFLNKEVPSKIELLSGKDYCRSQLVPIQKEKRALVSFQFRKESFLVRTRKSRTWAEAYDGTPHN